jgi:hypothetical protein
VNYLTPQDEKSNGYRKAMTYQGQWVVGFVDGAIGVDG